MKEKILAALKREYASLGLGDDILGSQASVLAAMNVATEENLEQIVKSQKELLESLQKANDKRASDAAEKARKTAQKEADELKAKLDEAVKKTAEVEKQLKEGQKDKKVENKNEDKVDEKSKLYAEILAKVSESQKEAQEAMQAKIDELVKQNSEALENVKRLQGEVEEARKADVAKARNQFILSEAQRLGISQGRIDEGFCIKDDATNEDIQTYLAKVASNQKAIEAPSLSHFRMAESKEADTAVVDAVATALVGN